MISLVPFLAAIVLVLVASAAVDMVWGDRGRPGNLTKFYRRLLGEVTKRRGQSAAVQLRRELADQGSRLRVGPWLWAVRIAIGAVIWWVSGSFFIGMIATFAADLLPRIWLASARRKRKLTLARQFAPALQCLAGSIRAGNSLATGITLCPNDLARMLQGQRYTPMLTELRALADEVQAGIPVAEALEHFRERCGVEEVDDFVLATAVIRRTGGNIAGQIDRLAQVLGQKIAIRQEILTLTAGKRMEANMLTVAPMAMVVMLMLTSPSYMAPLFHTLVGKVLIVVGGALLGGAAYLGRRIIDIPV